MKQLDKTEVDKAKPFMVRLSSARHRTAYEKFCADNGRSLDSQARFMIVKILIENGYLKLNEQKEVRR